MGQGGAGFAQGFADTLIKLGPQIEAARDRREELKIRADESSLRAKLYDVQLKDAQRKFAAQTKLSGAIAGGMPGAVIPGSEDFTEQAGPRVPIDWTNRAHVQSLLPALIEAEHPLGNALAADVFKGAEKQRRWDGFLGGGGMPGAGGSMMPAAPPGGLQTLPYDPSRPSRLEPQPFDPSRPAQMETLPMPTGPNAPGGMRAPSSAPGGAGSPLYFAPPGVPLQFGPMARQETSVTVDPVNESISFTTKNSNVQWQRNTEEQFLPDGRQQTVTMWWNPENPSQRYTEQSPPRIPQEYMKVASETARIGGGLPWGSKIHLDAIHDTNRALSYATPEARQAALEEVEDHYGGIAAKLRASQSAPAPAGVTPGLARRARETAEQRTRTNAAGVIDAETPAKVDQARRVKEATEAVPERPSAAERKELADQLDAIDSWQRVGRLYRKEFVGPLSGRVGAFKETTGGIGPVEAQFRAAQQAANNAMIRAEAGLSQTTGEAERMAKQLPTPNLPPEVFEARLSLTQINSKILGIKKREVLEASKVDVSRMPRITLTPQEQRKVAADIALDFHGGQLPRDEALNQLRSLGQYKGADAEAHLRPRTGKDQIDMAAVIAKDYRDGRVTRYEASQQLRGLAHYMPRDADSFLSTLDLTMPKRGR